jgi:hypothetical protein
MIKDISSLKKTMRLIYEKPRILRWALELKFKRRPIG